MCRMESLQCFYNISPTCTRMINGIMPKKYACMWLIIYPRMKNTKINFFLLSHLAFILSYFVCSRLVTRSTKNDQVFFYHKSFLYFSFLSYVYSQRTITSYLITYSSSKCTLISIIVIDSNDQFKLFYRLSSINRY